MLHASVMHAVLDFFMRPCDHERDWLVMFAQQWSHFRFFFVYTWMFNHTHQQHANRVRKALIEFQRCLPRSGRFCRVCSMTLSHHHAGAGVEIAMTGNPMVHAMVMPMQEIASDSAAKALEGPQKTHQRPTITRSRSWTSQSSMHATEGR